MQQAEHRIQRDGGVLKIPSEPCVRMSTKDKKRMRQQEKRRERRAIQSTTGELRILGAASRIQEPQGRPDTQRGIQNPKGVIGEFQGGPETHHGIQNPKGEIGEF